MIPLLNDQNFLILDGALATELEARGADLNDPLWSAKILLERPDLIRQVHYDYFLAGADVATTATYQATFEGFARRGIAEEKARELLLLAVRLAMEAREQFWREPENRQGRRYPLVVASIGPYGAFLADGSEYRGQYGLSVEELMDFHRPRLQVLAESGADLLALETIPSPEEAEALIGLLQEFPAARAWLGFQCRDEAHVAQGELLADALAAANTSDQIIAVGVNCTAPRFVLPLLEIAAGATDKPLLAYPNSGEKWDAARHCWLAGGQPVDFGQLAMQWYAAGARLIGGCCRTCPEDIRDIRRRVTKISAP